MRVAWNTLHSSGEKNLAHQGRLQELVTQLFWDIDVKVNALKEPFKNPTTGRSFELDIWIPSIQLGIEFQDAYHFSPVWYYQQSLSDIAHRDNTKGEQLQSKGATLLGIPCWWDATKESIVGSIQFERPDLLHFMNLHIPVPLNPPTGFFTNSGVPDIGQVMLASAATLTNDLLIPEVNGWWMGEKYDGIRCIWHPIARQLYTRRGFGLLIPEAYCERLAASVMFMDGELWFGRGNFSEFSAIDTLDFTFAFLRNIVFDSPAPSLHQSPFEGRYAALLKIPDIDAFLVISARVWCESSQHIQNSFRHVLQDGGEGVILRKIHSRYENNRSASLVKLKAARGDTEALVISQHDTAALLEMPNGVRFTVNSTHLKLSIGNVVTIDYDSFSLKERTPVNPIISRIRKDLLWEDVVTDRFSYPPPLSSSPEEAGNSSMPSYWTSAKGIATRYSLIQLALIKGLDPFTPTTWYSMSRDEFLPEKAGQTINFVKGSHVKTLMWVFPDIGLQIDKFPQHPAGYWVKTKK